MGLKAPSVIVLGSGKWTKALKEEKAVDFTLHALGMDGVIFFLWNDPWAIVLTTSLILPLGGDRASGRSPTSFIAEC